MSNVIGRLGPYPTQPGRLAILNADQHPLVTFGLGETREHVALIIAASSYTLHDDDTITEQAPDTHDATLSAAAQAGGVPAGWAQDDLAELAVKHYLLAEHALNHERKLWHLRQRTMLLDLLSTKEQEDGR